MFVIIAGGGRTAAQLATLLLAQGHKVHVIEDQGTVLAQLHHELPTEAIYEGKPLDPSVLVQAGIERADALATCMHSDADNLVVCYVARTLYGVPRTIARINNPRNAWLHDEKFHVDVALNHAEVLASLIEEEMSLGDMMTLAKLRRGKYSLVAEKIPPGAKAVGVAIKDLALPVDCVIAAIIRDGEMVLPAGYTVFEAGDEVLSITDRPGQDQLAVLFAAPGARTSRSDE
jgi:trk system potassium uptake protein TrkA